MAAAGVLPEDDHVTTTPAEPVDAAPGRGNQAVRRAQGLVRRGARPLGLLLLTFVAWVFVRGIVDPDADLSIDPAVIVAFGLVGAGVLLLRGQQPALDAAEGVAQVPRERSPLGVLTLSVASVIVGILILVGNLGITTVTIGQIAAAALTVVALGLVVGAWWGRSRFLVVVGVVLVPFVVAGGSMHFPLRGSIGDTRMNTRSIDDVASEYEVLLGSIHMNLADVREFTGEREIEIRMAAGDATIFVPDRIGLTVRGGIEWGNATIGLGREEGDDLAFENTIPGRPGQGHLTIDFSGGIASLYVERISQADLHGPFPPPDEDDRRRDREPKDNGTRGRDKSGRGRNREEA